MWVTFDCQVYTCQVSACFKFSWNAFYGTFTHHGASVPVPYSITHPLLPPPTHWVWLILLPFIMGSAAIWSLWALCHICEPTQWLLEEALLVILLLQVEKLRLIDLWFGWRFQDVQCQVQDVNLGLADWTAFTLSAHMQYKFWDFPAHPPHCTPPQCPTFFPLTLFYTRAHTERHRLC